MTRTRVKIDLDYAHAPGAVGIHYQCAAGAPSKALETSLVILNGGNAVEAADVLYGLMMVMINALGAGGYEIGEREVDGLVDRIYKARKNAG